MVEKRKDWRHALTMVRNCMLLQRLGRLHTFLNIRKLCSLTRDSRCGLCWLAQLDNRSIEAPQLSGNFSVILVFRPRHAANFCVVSLECLRMLTRVAKRGRDIGHNLKSMC